MPSSAYPSPALYSCSTRLSSDLQPGPRHGRDARRPRRARPGPDRAVAEGRAGRQRPPPQPRRGAGVEPRQQLGRRLPPRVRPARGRSEEHTSELQSRLHLVCRRLRTPHPRYTHALHDSLPIFSQFLGTAAMLDGLVVRGLDQTGLSQKAGPVVSDLRLSRGEVPASNHANSSGVDCLLAFDLLVADRKSTRLNSSHGYISYAVVCVPLTRAILMLYTTLFRSSASSSARPRCSTASSCAAWTRPGCRRRPGRSSATSASAAARCRRRTTPTARASTASSRSTCSWQIGRAHV